MRSTSLPIVLTLVLIGCGSGAATGSGGAGTSNTTSDASTTVQTSVGTASGTGGGGGGGPSPAGLGSVSNVVAATCPSGVPGSATCKQVTVAACPGIETEMVTATLAVIEPPTTVKGTVVHFKGGGGEGLETTGMQEYEQAGFRQVIVSWDTDWEQTAASGIKTAACRPATLLRWIFDEPTLQNGSRTEAFCGQGFSGGSGQLGYALAQYGLADYLDYVNELSGPPFARIDLGCDGDAPSTATVCGVADTMVLPGSLDSWENIQSPLTCGSKNVPAAELLRWKNDSVAIGGVYDYPKTDVQFFDCTNQSTAVTGMAQIYETLIAGTEGSGGMVGFHCYSQADSCMGEGLGQGDAAAIAAMIAGCTPRH